MGCQLAAINPIWSILIFSGTFRRGGRTIKMTILAQRTKGSAPRGCAQKAPAADAGFHMVRHDFVLSVDDLGDWSARGPAPLLRPTRRRGVSAS